MADSLEDVFDPYGHAPGQPGYIPSKPEGNPFYDAVESGLQQFTNGVKSWWKDSPLGPGYWQGKFQDFLGFSNLKDSVNSANSQGKIAYTKSGIPYDESNIDSQINALAQEYAYKRDDEAYDRLIAALKRNGMNPALILGNSASPMSSDTAYRSNYNMTTKDQVNSALKVGSILAIILGLLMKG